MELTPACETLGHQARGPAVPWVFLTILVLRQSCVLGDQPQARLGGDRGHRVPPTPGDAARGCRQHMATEQSPVTAMAAWLPRAAASRPGLSSQQPEDRIWGDPSQGHTAGRNGARIPTHLG